MEGLGLPLGLEAPVMTPNGVIFFFCFFFYFFTGVFCHEYNAQLEAEIWYSFTSYILGCVLQHCASHLLSYISLTGS